MGHRAAACDARARRWQGVASRPAIGRGTSRALTGCACADAKPPAAGAVRSDACARFFLSRAAAAFVWAQHGQQ